ncbi:hypothetical protein B0T13DRAFT_477808 [Neurospora crassa]|nr:hypothetical protein B0T13DRAFT_477808 [Neurospora crassa]
MIPALSVLMCMCASRTSCFYTTGFIMLGLNTSIPFPHCRGELKEDVLDCPSTLNTLRHCILGHKTAKQRNLGASHRYFLYERGSYDFG